MSKRADAVLKAYFETMRELQEFTFDELFHGIVEKVGVDDDLLLPVGRNPTIKGDLRELCEIGGIDRLPNGRYRYIVRSKH